MEAATSVFVASGGRMPSSLPEADEDERELADLRQRDGDRQRRP